MLKNVLIWLYLNFPSMKRFTHLSILAVVLLLASCASKNQDSQDTAASIPSFTSVDQSIKSQVAGFLADYFALNKMLIEDSLAGAKDAASRFGMTASSFNIEKLSPEQLDFYLVHSANLKSSLESLSKTNDIESARVELATISEAMYAMVKAFHPNDTPLYYQYCPMARDNKGANWLSLTKELVNPYMGQMMLACGRTQEKID
jgi:membrane fusion protein, copper/silver efflux system